jgi:hypothetical protein
MQMAHVGGSGSAAADMFGGKERERGCLESKEPTDTTVFIFLFRPTYQKYGEYENENKEDEENWLNKENAFSFCGECPRILLCNR